MPQLRPHDRVMVETESTERPPRAGVIEEVLGHDPPRYRIRWDDGRESIYTPAAGALRKDRRDNQAVAAAAARKQRD